MAEPSSRGEGWFNGIARSLGLSTKPAPGPDRRYEPRRKTKFRATISGPSSSSAATGIDLHHHGLRVLCRQPFPPGSVVFVHVKREELWGFAYVRHCTSRGRSYQMGLEFRSEPMRQELGNWYFQRVDLNQGHGRGAA